MIEFDNATPDNGSREHRVTTSFLTRRSFGYYAFAGVSYLSAGRVFARNDGATQISRKDQKGSRDSTMALLREGYQFIPNRCKSLKSEVFQAKILSKEVMCLSGHNAAKLFYNNDLFERKNAAPERLQKSLTGKGGVQSLDDAAHRNRKAMFLSLMSPGKLGKFVKNLNDEQNRAGLLWAEEKEVTLFDEAQEIYFRAACTWAGVPLKDSEARERSKDMGKMVDGLGSLGYRNYRGRFARKRSEAWMVEIINQVRGEKLAAPKGTALHTMAWHKDQDGQLLNTDTVAVELLNIVRPIAAIATYISFMALALHSYPQYGKSLRGASDGDYQAFVQEVRRFYPFTPFVLAKVRKDFTWRGYGFPKGRTVMLSAYGVDHDPKLWHKPEQFNPGRFKSWGGDRFDFIPHGGGDYLKGHRCAGEQLTIQAMKATLRFLVAGISYDVPSQDLSFSLSRIPALPKSGFVMANVKLRKNGANS